MQITAILPVSRVEYLDRVLQSLRNQTLKPHSLLVIFDGSDDDYIEVRNKIVGQPFNQVLCMKSTNDRPAFAISERREHISNIHNQFREVIDYSNWIFSIEDDGILPANALKKLVEAATPQTGIITGVELGRWGVPYVGAWVVDDVFNTTYAQSLENKAGQELIEPIDACGLYCALIRGDVYKDHEFSAGNGLGPDVNLALYARQLGYQNYISWSIPVTHLTNDHGNEIEIPATDPSTVVSLHLEGTTWRQNKFPSGQVFPLTL